jgi:hypothetical protein
MPGVMEGGIHMKWVICTLMILITSGCVSLRQKNAMLFFAARDGNTAQVQRMLDSGANINYKDYNDNTPLLVAIKNNQMETATLLASRGADVNAQDGYGDTPLLVAIKKNRTEMAALLASRGANINVQDKYGDTPLNLAIMNGQRDTARLLVSKGANVNTKGALDDTPLHVSIYKGDSEMASLLRSKGADENLLNRYGLVPREMQTLRDVEEMVVQAAQLISTSGQWTDHTKARGLYDALKRSQDRYLINALVLQVIRGHDMRLCVLLLAIKLGVIGSEEKLNGLLLVYGDKPMAEDYLNSGSSLLYDGASRWASAHGFHILTGQGSHRSEWGRF